MDRLKNYSEHKITQYFQYGPVPYCSHLIYNPSRRVEAWRYISYSLVHSGLFHVTFNILIQLVLGIPLEMVHR